MVDSAIITGLGDSIDANWQRLCRGESAIGPVSHFSTDRIEFHDASVVPELRDIDCKNHILELTKRAITQLRPLSEHAFVIWTGVKGNVETVEKGKGCKKDDLLFLPGQYREEVCRSLGIANSGLEINAACASSTVSMAIGAQLIASGRHSSVLVCGADIVSRFVFMGFSALRALSPSVCRPFDEKRDGLCLGDGSAAVLLASADFAAEHGYDRMAEIAGWGISNDANHITGPARDGCGLIQAVQTALDKAKLTHDSIEAFCAHGTGTVFNDAMELTGIETLFGDRRFPVFSVKGAIGHTLGAAGAIEATICARALRERRVPATSALQCPEDRAKGRVVNSSQSFSGNNILTTNSGFGGINAAIVLKAN